METYIFLVSSSPQISCIATSGDVTLIMYEDSLDRQMIGTVDFGNCTYSGLSEIQGTIKGHTFSSCF
jgi:hypothetical protein